MLAVQQFKVLHTVGYTEAYRRRVPNLVVVHHPVQKRYVSNLEPKNFAVITSVFLVGVGPPNATTIVTAAGSGVGSAIPSNNYNTVVTAADRASV